MRKIFSTFLAALFMSVSLHAQTSGTCGENLTWTLQNNVLTISGTGEMTNWSEGASHYAPWYSQRDYILSAIIGDSVTSIGRFAFYNCHNLRSVKVSQSLTTLGAYSFEGCSMLASISIPYGITLIDWDTFAGCTSLTSFVVPGSVTRLSSYVFGGCSSLSYVYIPRSVTSIEYAFSGNNSRTLSIYVEDPQSLIYSQGTSPINQLFANSFATVYVPCGTVAACQDAITWVDHKSKVFPYPFSFYEFNVSANDTTYGQIIQNLPDSICDTVSIEAVPFYGHHFDRWSNGETVNPYDLLVTQDTIITAIFAKDTFSLRTQAADSTQGQTFGDTIALYRDKISIRAVSAFGYEFARWSDGNTDNPRTVELTRDTVLTAEFTPLFPGQCGDNLYWTFIGDTLVIWGSGDMYDYSRKSAPWTPIATAIQELSLPAGITSLAEGAFYRCSELKSVSVPNSVTTIGARAFIQCTALGTVTLGSALNTIGDYGFAYCTGIQTITSYNTTPPAVKSNTFLNVPSATIVYVPASALNSYKQHNVWGQFDVCPIESDIRLVNGNTSSPHKIIANGQLFILLPNGTRYDATGKKVE